MVKIEFLKSESSTTHSPESFANFGHQPLDKSAVDERNDSHTYTIVALAKACAATQIQSRWRGIQCRKLRYKIISNGSTVNQKESNIDEKAALIIQKDWRRHRNRRLKVEAIHSRICNNSKSTSKSKCFEIGNNIATQTEFHNFIEGGHSNEESVRRLDVVSKQDDKEEETKYQAKPDVISSRKEVVKDAYTSSCLKNHKKIRLSGFEILNVLQAMSVLAYREYEILSKTILSNFNGSRRKSEYSFSVRLTGPIQDFEKDINSAWKSLIQTASELSSSSAMFLRKKGNRLKSNSTSEVARSHIQKLISLSDDSLLIIERNENVILYNHETIQTFLLSIDLDMDEDDEIDRKKTILDYLELKRQKASSSYLRTKIESALEVLNSVINWEEEHMGNHKIGSGERQELSKEILDEKDLLISKLREEVKRLKHTIHLIERNPYTFDEKENNLNKKKVFNSPLVKGKSPNQKKVSKQSFLHNSALRESSTKKAPVKQRRRQQESVNRVDINFSDLFGKEEKSKSTKSSFSSKKNHIRKATERKQPPGIPMYSYKVPEPKSKMSLAQTITKAREKRSHYFTSKVAWTDGETKRRQNIEIKTKKEFHDSSTLFSNVPADYRHQKEESIIGNIEIHNNEAKNLRPDIRFNAILEKLRQTTAEIEPHFK